MKAHIATSMGRTARMAGGALAAGLLCLPFAANAQDDFPSERIEVISHASAGGGTDTTIRMWLDQAAEILGQDMVVIYKQGGGARAAHEYLMSRPADGYTLMATTETHLYTIARGNSPITIDDVQGVASAMKDPSVIVVRDDSPYETYEDLVEDSQDQALNWGVAQVGGTEHIGIARWAEAAGVEYRVVPFGGGGDMLTALRSGAVDASLANVSEAAGMVEDGDLRALVILSDQPSATMPDVPTAASKGHDVSVNTTRGYVVRADTPPERVAVLEEALLEAMQGDRFQEYLDSSGVDPEASIQGSEAWDAQLKDEYAQAKKVFDELGLANQ